MSELGVTDRGQLDLDIADLEPESADYEWPENDWVDQGWEPGDYGYPDDDGADDDEAWLAGLPSDVREEFLAGPWTGAGEAIPAGFTHRDRWGGPCGVGFASGGALDTAEPGPWLAKMTAFATAEGHAKLGESELIGVLCAWRRMASWAAAGEVAAVITLARRRAAQSRDRQNPHLAEHVDDEIAAALSLTGRSADRLLAVSSELARFDDVRDALQRGEIDWPKACRFADELAVLDDDAAAQRIASKLLSRASDMTTGQLQAALRRAVLAVDPQAADRRRDNARKDAEVQTWDEPSGNSAMAGRELPPADVIAADMRLTALARWLHDRGSEGTISQLRASVYTALLAGRPLESLLPDSELYGLLSGDGDPITGASASGTATGTSASETAHGKPASDPVVCDQATDGTAWARVRGTIHLTLPLSSFLGGTGPGEVASYGPVDATTGRELAAMLAAESATKWCLTVTDDDGRAIGHACARRGPPPNPGPDCISWALALRAKLQLLEIDRCSHRNQAASYQPPATLRHRVEIRQRRCCFPGCSRPAHRCDLDHTVPYDQGGRTCECNLAPLCRRHHQAKQLPGWQLTQPQPGEMVWRLPSGRSYATCAEPYPV